MSATFTEFDRAAMARALELAERGLETTDPNPRVGCVIAQGDRIVSEGWHEWPGEPHAEAMALAAMSSPSQGATAYVTLEPCSHFGRTPPCATALIAAKVGRVVFAVEDPNPLVSGGGASLLREAGIKVESGLMQAEAEEINVGFLKRMRTGRPFVRLKMAMSLDGRTALSNGASQWITSADAREDVQRWRARSSAVLTGVGTVLADDPQLNVRLPSQRRRQPVRVVLDTLLRTTSHAKLFSSEGDVLIFTSSRDTAMRARFEPLMDLDSVLKRLGELDMNEVLVEAGATLAGAFIREQLVDELLLYIAPVLLGPQARPLLDLPELTSLQDSPRFRLIDSQPIGTDIRLRLRPQRP